jgi:hypothetical protein
MPGRVRMYWGSRDGGKVAYDAGTFDEFEHDLGPPAPLGALFALPAKWPMMTCVS